MNYSYSPYDTTLRYTRILYTVLLALFVTGLLLASGALVYFEDGSFILNLGQLHFSGCNPLAICS